MRQMQPVLWTKGLLLTPQHLQTQDRFLEDSIEFQLSALTVYPWGFHRLTIDREALSAGQFGISAATGILPDGLLFEVPESDPAPPPRPLAASWQPDQQSLDIFLAIPEYRYGGLNVSNQQADRNTRYLAEVLSRRDENTGLAEKSLLIARKNFRVLTEGESLEGSSALHVARILRSATGDYQLDPRFVPPLIDIGGSEYLMSIARRLVELLAAKSTAISDRRRQKNQSLAEFGIADVANFWLLYTVNTYLPQFRHLFETRRGHHADLSRCFTDLDEKLRFLIETVVPANYISLPVRLVAPSVYAAAIDQERYLAAPEWYLALSAALEGPELVRRASQLIKISSHDHIDRLIRQALPGVGLTHVPNPPSAVPVKLEHQYFRLARTGPEWDAVTQARNIAAYVSSDFPGVQLELLIVLPARE